MPGTRGPSVGLSRGTVDPEIDTLNLARGADHREARLIPEGIGVTREGCLASGWCSPTIEVDSRPHGRWAPERSPLRSGQPRSFAFSWKRALGLDPEVVAPDRIVEHVQHHRSGDAGGARPAPSGTSSGGNGFQVRKLGSSAFRGRPARRRSGSTPVATRRHDDQVCVFDAPGGAPHRIAPTAICLIAPSGDGLLTDATLGPGRNPVSRPRRGAGLRRGQVQPMLPKQQARPEAGGSQASQVASAWT